VLRELTEENKEKSSSLLLNTSRRSALRKDTMTEDDNLHRMVMRDEKWCPRADVRQRVGSVAP
jgi:hypothetical protein